MWQSVTSPVIWTATDQLSRGGIQRAMKHVGSVLLMILSRAALAVSVSTVVVQRMTQLDILSFIWHLDVKVRVTLGLVTYTCCCVRMSYRIYIQHKRICIDMYGLCSLWYACAFALVHVCVPSYWSIVDYFGKFEHFCYLSSTY